MRISFATRSFLVCTGSLLTLALGVGSASAGEGRLIAASGEPNHRELLSIDIEHPSHFTSLGEGEAYLPGTPSQGVISAGDKLQSLKEGETKRTEFATSPKLSNAGPAAMLGKGRLFVISQSNRRLIEFDAAGKFVTEHFLQTTDGATLTPRSIAVIDLGLIVFAAEAGNAGPAQLFLLTPSADKTQWRNISVNWPDKQPVTNPGQLCRVTPQVAALVDSSGTRVIEFDFAVKDKLQTRVAATLDYATAATPVGLAYDPARDLYYVGSAGKDRVVAIARATGAPAKIASFPLIDPTFLIYVGPSSSEPAGQVVPVRKSNP